MIGSNANKLRSAAQRHWWRVPPGAGDGNVYSHPGDAQHISGRYRIFEAVSWDMLSVASVTGERMDSVSGRGGRADAAELTGGRIDAAKLTGDRAGLAGVSGGRSGGVVITGGRG